eukprot:m.27327 g.27327  ORF g.27327 m.27327 type:complete len:372 (+) comp29923_c0_seq2:108-1223(+)
MGVLLIWVASFAWTFSMIYGQKPSIIELFTPGEDYPCYRQPVLVTAKDGTVLAFAEGRNNTSCAGKRDGYPKYILLKRSSNFGGAWHPMQLLWQGDPDYYVALHDSSKDVFWLFVQEDSKVLLFNSSDKGLNWSKPESLIIDSDFPVFKPAVGHGIQIDSALCGPHKVNCPQDRLVVPFVCQDKANGITAGMYHSCILFSDNGGMHWHLGGYAQLGSRECVLVQTFNESGNATLYVNERNVSPTPGHRLISYSYDGGESLENMGTDNALVEPVTADWTGIVASLCRFDESGKRRIVYTSPLDPNKRAVMGIRISSDEGHSWTHAKIIDPGLAAYSDTQRLNSTTVAVLYEHGKESFADSIGFLTVGINWLE